VRWAPGGYPPLRLAGLPTTILAALPPLGRAFASGSGPDDWAGEVVPLAVDVPKGRNYPLRLRGLLALQES
jgi:hypothetical protein